MWYRIKTLNIDLNFPFIFIECKPLYFYFLIMNLILPTNFFVSRAMCHLVKAILWTRFSSLSCSFKTFIRSFVLKVIIVCGGSYRRGKAFCGDLDIIITHPDGQRSTYIHLILCRHMMCFSVVEELDVFLFYPLMMS